MRVLDWVGLDLDLDLDGHDRVHLVWTRSVAAAAVAFDFLALRLLSRLTFTFPLSVCLRLLRRRS